MEVNKSGSGVLAKWTELRAGWKLKLTELDGRLKGLGREARFGTTELVEGGGVGVEVEEGRKD